MRRTMAKAGVAKAGPGLSAPGCKEFAVGGPLGGLGGKIPRTTFRKQQEVKPPPATPNGQTKPAEQSDVVFDPETGDLYKMCRQCRLPLGDVAYEAEKDGGRLHGECKAQLMLNESKKLEEARLKKDAALKKKRRAQYDLGWRVERVPGALSRTTQGSCGLVWQEDTRAVCIVPTAEQAAAVNLEYLSLALEVRRRDGREPMFSLDPKDGLLGEKDKLWQVKRFEPEWLAGTSVGEVMFQADYHLKELSMGEFAQPVMGMKSCFDYSAEEGIQDGWNAREWFVVNSAEIQLTESNLMLPAVQMGVQARETRQGEDGLEDVPITRSDHPLVRYAEDFTHYFDLIAERKSVVYHLRELAKASVVAKFLLENESPLDESWFSVAGEAEPVACGEIPQLWNEHGVAQIQVVDGKIVDTEHGTGRRTFGVYGGVEMGIDRLGRVAGVRAPPGRVVAAKVPSLTARMVSARGAVAEFPVLAPGVPKGVDLNLDRFELATAVEASTEVPAGSWNSKEFTGDSFWPNLTKSSLPEDEKKFLQELFHPGLCDRRDDGELFMPPDTGASHVARLRQLLEEEEAVRHERESRFLSPDFAVEEAGDLFPSSWQGESQQAAQSAPRALHARPDYEAQARRLIKTAAPVFDKTAEDGARFRVYRVGSLEVRTVQGHGGEEQVRAVFAARARGGARAGGQGSAVAGAERVVKAVEYIEKAGPGSHRFYVTLETDRGSVVVTEKLADQTLAWAENPDGLECRSSLAKVVRAADCEGIASIADMEAFRLAEASREANQGYAHRAFLRALPAKEKTWAVLDENERHLAKRLGIHGAAGWDQAASQVWAAPWQQLDARQQEAARALGFGEAAWGQAERRQEC